MTRGARAERPRVWGALSPETDRVSRLQGEFVLGALADQHHARLPRQFAGLKGSQGFRQPGWRIVGQVIAAGLAAGAVESQGLGEHDRHVRAVGERDGIALVLKGVPDPDQKLVAKVVQAGGVVTGPGHARGLAGVAGNQGEGDVAEEFLTGFGVA